MPLCTVNLLALHSTTPNPLLTFLTTLHKSDIRPLVISSIVRWIILPTQISTFDLLGQNIHWDILLILPSTSPLPNSLEKLIQHQWSIIAGIPSRIVHEFHEKNKEFLNLDPGTVPRLSNDKEKDFIELADSAQNLELSPELQSWIHSFSTSGRPEGHGAVSMLNLLSFKSGMKESYLKYGTAFAESIGSRHGGNAKIVGTVVSMEGDGNKKGDGGWDEVALAHYPSIRHFEEMLRSKDYQEVNKRYRVPALRDTFILCTSEIRIRNLIGEGRKGDIKL